MQSKLSSTSKKCLKNQNATHVCADQKCHKINPFICADEQCQCAQFHPQCRQIRVKLFLTKMETFNSKQDSQLVEIQNKIDEHFDKLIDELSDQRDRIINQIKNKQIPWLSKNENKQFNDEKISGSIIANSIMRSNQEPKQSQQKMKSVLKQVQNMTKGFKSNQIGNYVHSIEQILFEKQLYSQFFFQFDWNLPGIQNIQKQKKASRLVQQYMLRYNRIQKQVQYIESGSVRNALSDFPFCDNYAIYLWKCKDSEDLAKYNIFIMSLKQVFNMTLKQLQKDKILFQCVKNQFVIHDQSSSAFNLQQILEKLKQQQEKDNYKKYFDQYIIVKQITGIVLQFTLYMYAITNHKKNNTSLSLHAINKINSLLRKISYLFKQIEKNQIEIQKIDDIQGFLGIFLLQFILNKYKLRLTKHQLSKVVNQICLKQLQILGFTELIQKQLAPFNQSEYLKERSLIIQSEQNWKIHEVGRHYGPQTLQQKIGDFLKDLQIPSKDIYEKLQRNQLSMINVQTGQIEDYQQEQQQQKQLTQQQKGKQKQKRKQKRKQKVSKKI